jgi:hypothetical protein
VCVHRCPPGSPGVIRRWTSSPIGAFSARRRAA